MMADSTDILISVRDVSVSYWLKQGAIRRRRYWAVNNISFDLRKGESLGIVGRNGAGKSTLLRVIAGVVKPDRGVINCFDNTVCLLSLQLGFISNLSGRENAILGGLMMGVPRRDMEKRLGDVMEISELDEFFDQPIRTYSSGMRARLGFAVAMQVDPDVMLLDEVTSVGDEAFRQKSFSLLREKVEKRAAMVLVSHHGRSVKQQCDRAIWIDKGGIRAEGDAETVVDAYNDEIFGRTGDTAPAKATTEDAPATE